MKISNIKLAKIKPYENNPRTNDGAVEFVQHSIEKFGFKVPIIVDKDNFIVAGHTRYKAALNLNLDTVPVIVADDLTPEQIKAFRIADNKTAEKAQWDYEKLGIEVGDLDALDLGLDLKDIGFTDFELDVLRGNWEPDEDEQQIFNKPEDPDIEAIIKKKRIVITYEPEQEELIKNLLKVEKLNKTTYDISEIG